MRVLSCQWKSKKLHKKPSIIWAVNTERFLAMLRGVHATKKLKKKSSSAKKKRKKEGLTKDQYYQHVLDVSDL